MAKPKAADPIPDSIGDKNPTETLLESGIHTPSASILLTGSVDEDMYEQVVSALLLIQAEHGGCPPLFIALNSGGGCWYNGIAIYDYLNSYPGDLTIRVAGEACSMASVILQAADHREVGRHAVVMVHDGHTTLRGTPSEVTALAKLEQLHLDQMYSIYAERSGRPKSYWAKVCKKDTYYLASEAIELGLADRVF